MSRSGRTSRDVVATGVAQRRHPLKFAWTWTDDLSDPCPYCVFWQEPPGGVHPGNLDQMVPLAADGSVALHVYRMPHPDCARSVAEHVDSGEGI